jgi:Fe-S-cluster containining protein
MTDQPWYSDGLRFKCTQCGNCCTGAPGFVWVNQAEIEALAALVGMSDVAAFEKKYVRQVGMRKSLVEFPNGYCVFFDSEHRTCTVYSARPRQCRTWPFWNSNLKTEEAWQRTCEICPGSGQGRLYSLQQIQKNAAAINI